MATDYREVKENFSRLLEAPSFDFDKEARKLFTYQFQTNTPYQAYCQALGTTPETVSYWKNIPPLPGDAFKADPPPFCGQIQEATHHFLSSGTTRDIKSTHYFRETESYEKSIMAGWRQAELPELKRRCFLFQHPDHLPNSSLAHMFETLACSNNDASWLIDGDGNIDPRPLQETSEPILLFATSLTLLHLLNDDRTQTPLPSGSWIFQTGGFKGLGDSIDRRDLYRRLEYQLGISPNRIINEYGMTELSSQAYAIGPEKPYRCPPWLRFQIIDPETGSEQPKGVNGYLYLYDLANLSSALAIRTQDIACAVDEDSFILHGRDPEALPRGCSRAQFSSFT